MLAGEGATEVDADLGDVAALEVAVGPREIDELEDAKRVRLLGAFPRVDGADAVLVDDDDFARLDVADELGLDQVQRAGLAGEDMGGVDAFPEVLGQHHAVGILRGDWFGPGQFTEDERAESERIAHADEFVLAHDDQRVGALDALHHCFQRMGAVAVERSRQQVEDDLAVHRGLENRTLLFQLGPQAGGVGEVAVVTDGDLAAGAVHDQRLGVLDVRAAGGRVADVTDGEVTGQ